MSADRKVKICLAGESQVGKSSIIRRFVTGEFHDKYVMTLGAAVCKKDIDWMNPATGDMEKASFIIWDVMGNKDLPELLTLAYFKGVLGVLLVFDITRRETFEKLERWSIMVGKTGGAIPSIILGNKWDLKDYAKVSEDDLRGFSLAHGADCLLTSARTGDNVDRAFEILWMRIRENFKASEAEATAA